MHYQRLLVGLAKFRWTRSENSGCAPIRHGPGHSIRHAAPSPGPAVTSGFDLSRARPACHFAAPEWCRRIPHAVAQESAGTPIDCDLNHSLDGVTTRRATAPIAHPWQRSQLSPSSPGLASRPPRRTPALSNAAPPTAGPAAADAASTPRGVDDADSPSADPLARRGRDAAVPPSTYAAGVERWLSEPGVHPVIHRRSNIGGYYRNIVFHRVFRLGAGRPWYPTGLRVRTGPSEAHRT